MKKLGKFKNDIMFLRGEYRLSFVYNFVGLHWKLLKLYPTIHSYLFLFLYNVVLICSQWEQRQLEGVLCLHGGSLRYEEIGKIQKWYDIRNGENVGLHFDVNLSASLEYFWRYTQPNIHINFYFFTMYSVELFPLNES